MSSNKWPLQSSCAQFYGTPGTVAFESNNLVLVPLPFVMHMDALVIKRIRIHRNCVASLTKVVAAVAPDAAKWMPGSAELEFSGSYNFRPMRNGRSLSMHAYGCAIDIGASRNSMGSPGLFKENHPWVKAFESQGWVWGGRWGGKSCDPMHFQAARVG